MLSANFIGLVSDHIALLGETYATPVTEKVTFLRVGFEVLDDRELVVRDLLAHQALEERVHAFSDRVAHFHPHIALALSAFLNYLWASFLILNASFTGLGF